MASYQPTILDAPPQYGFLSGLARGLPAAGEKFANIYAQSMMQNMAAQKKGQQQKESFDKFQAAMSSNRDLEIDQITMDESGIPKITYKRKKTPESALSKDPVKAIRNAMLGVGTEETGKALGYQPQQSMPMNKAGMISRAILSPQTGASDLPFSLTPMNAQMEQMQAYPDIVKKGIMGDFFPGMTKEQATRDIMGLSMETPAEKLAAQQAGEQRKRPIPDPAITATVKQNIKTVEDIDELLKNRKDYEDAGVDVISILKEYIKTNPDPGILDKIKRFLSD